MSASLNGARISSILYLRMYTNIYVFVKHLTALCTGPAKVPTPPQDARLPGAAISLHVFGLLSLLQAVCCEVGDMGEIGQMGSPFTSSGAGGGRASDSTVIRPSSMARFRVSTSQQSSSFSSFEAPHS